MGSRPEAAVRPATSRLPTNIQDLLSIQTDPEQQVGAGATCTCPQPPADVKDLLRKMVRLVSLGSQSNRPRVSSSPCCFCWCFCCSCHWCSEWPMTIHVPIQPLQEDIVRVCLFIDLNFIINTLMLSTLRCSELPMTIHVPIQPLHR